jgi:hypothetical protein
MPAALQVVNFFKQNITGGALEALTPGTGDSNTFQDFTPGSAAYLADVRGVDDASPCEVSLIASRFHDQILGITGWVPDGSTLAPVNRSTSISPPGADQPIYPSDVLTVQVLGTAADNVNVTVVLYYSDLPGIAAKLRTWDAVRGSIVNLVGVDVALDASSGPAQGDWSAAVSLSAGGRRLDAGRYYAVLGFTAAEPLAAMSISSFETGNIRIGGPVIADGEKDSGLLKDIAITYNAALIPIIAGNNQDTVLVQCADPAASTVATTVMLAELSGPLA